MKILCVLLAVLFLAGCGGNSAGVTPSPDTTAVVPTPTLSPFQTYVDVSGNTVGTRFRVPDGATRDVAEAGSFGAYFRALPLKSNGSQIYQYDGEPYAYQNDHAAVVDMEIGTRDRLQVADAMVRLWAEYLFASAHYDAIQFHLTSGFLFRYEEWQDGYRLELKDNVATMVKKEEPDSSYEQFTNYLNRLYSYVTTRSLVMDVSRVDLTDIQIGDVFLESGAPGWCAMVVDICRTDNEVYFMLAESGFPAQDIHILQNKEHPELYVWYKLSDCTEGFATPRHIYEKTNLVRLQNGIED